MSNFSSSDESYKHSKMGLTVAIRARKVYLLEPEIHSPNRFLPLCLRHTMEGGLFLNKYLVLDHNRVCTVPFSSEFCDAFDTRSTLFESSMSNSGSWTSDSVLSRFWTIAAPFWSVVWFWPLVVFVPLANCNFAFQSSLNIYRARSRAVNDVKIYLFWLQWTLNEIILNYFLFFFVFSQKIKKSKVAPGVCFIMVVTHLPLLYSTYYLTLYQIPRS